MSALRAADQVMFEVYREGSYNRKYRVVYFTELGDWNRDAEISRALAGDHFLDGYLAEVRKEEAKKVITRALERLNDGENLAPEELERELEPFLA
jgi:hypothetical protein